MPTRATGPAPPLDARDGPVSVPGGRRPTARERISSVRAAARNTTVSSLLHTVDAQVKTSAPWQTRTVEDAFGATLAEHRAITEAIRDGDAEAARLRMLEHHEHGRDTRIRQKVRRDTGGGCGESAPLS